LLFDIVQEISHQLIESGEYIVLLPFATVPVIAFAALVVVADDARPVLAVTQAVFQPV
jgi:hypothetical protein